MIKESRGTPRRFVVAKEKHLGGFLWCVRGDDGSHKHVFRTPFREIVNMRVAERKRRRVANGESLSEFETVSSEVGHCVNEGFGALDADDLEYKVFENKRDGIAGSDVPLWMFRVPSKE